MRRIITYGTFDTLHHGHIRLLRRARALGDHLTVALSTDAFNAIKGKTAHFPYEERARDLLALRYVDQIIPEHDWGQKRADIERLAIDIFCMGSDWTGKFDFLRDLCEVVYLERTPGVCSTGIRKGLSAAAQ